LVPDPGVSTVGREEDYFYANANSNPTLAAQTPVDFQRPGTTIFGSRWAEIMYFLVPNGTTANGEILYTLYRRQRLLLPPGSPSVAWNAGNEAINPNVAWGWNSQTPAMPGPRVNMTTDIGYRPNRISPIFVPPNPQGTQLVQWLNGAGYGNSFGTWRATDLNANLGGDDILLTDVLSFEVKPNWLDTQASSNPGVGASAPWESFNLQSPAAGNLDWPYAYLPASGNPNPRNGQYNDTIYPVRTFDTWSAPDQLDPTYGSPPLRICIKSLQIRVRVFDQPGQTARQITIIQDM
jgi:hypothetical protein